MKHKRHFISFDSISELFLNIILLKKAVKKHICGLKKLLIKEKIPFKITENNMLEYNYNNFKDEQYPIIFNYKHKELIDIIKKINLITNF